jgi:hypothetical protein
MDRHGITAAIGETRQIVVSSRYPAIDWASQNRDRMEAIVTPLTWADWPENARRAPFRVSDPTAARR